MQNSLLSEKNKDRWLFVVRTVRCVYFFIIWAYTETVNGTEATVNIIKGIANTTLIPFFQSFLPEVAGKKATAVKIGGLGQIKLDDYGGILQAVNHVIDPDLSPASTLADLVKAPAFEVTVVLEGGFEKTYKVDFSLEVSVALSTLSIGDNFIIENGIVKFV